MGVRYVLRAVITFFATAKKHNADAADAKSIANEKAIRYKCVFLKNKYERQEV